MERHEIDSDAVVAGEIMTPHVIMLEKNEATFKDVINSLHKNKISAIFIHDTLKNDYYIISQTDIVNFLENGGMHEQNIAKISVTEIMQGPIEMLDIETPVDLIIRFMNEYVYKRVLISKNGKAIGVVSTRNIMKWNDTYFRPAKPQILLMMDNLTSNFIARHIFECNINDDVQRELIDLYGGALKAISIITNQIIKESGEIRHLVKDKRSILFEPCKNITGILICDYNSIELRHKLKKATKEFYRVHSVIFQTAKRNNRGVHKRCDISSIIPIFKDD